MDTRPPAGAELQITLIRRHVTLRIQHHDRASLLAGKLHAVLERGYVKGRDLYDLIWYLSDPTWPSPNLTLLSNALKQTGWQGEMPTRDNWRGLILSRLGDMNIQKAQQDVSPFLEQQHDLDWITLENLEQVLKGR